MTCAQLHDVAAELALGGASLAFPAVWPLSVAVLAAAASFAVVSGLGFAFHRGRSCRCFGALSRRTFDRAGLARAAGIAGLIKTILSVKHGIIPPNLHFSKLNPAIDLEAMNANVPTAATDWPGGARVASARPHHRVRPLS